MKILVTIDYKVEFMKKEEVRLELGFDLEGITEEQEFENSPKRGFLYSQNKLIENKSPVKEEKEQVCMEYWHESAIRENTIFGLI